MNAEFWNCSHRVPVVPLMGFPGANLTGTTIKQNLEDADIHFNSIEQLYKKYHPDAMIFMMDLTIEAEAIGLKVLKPEDASYTVIEHPVICESDIERFIIPDPSVSGRMPLMINVMKKMSKSFDCKKIAYVIGPYTLAGLMNGAGQVIKNVLKKPQFLKTLLDFTTDVISKYAQALEESGADAICILEPTATMLSPKDFVEFSGNYVQKLVLQCNVPIILHICGDTTHLIKHMIETGARGISLDSMVDFGKIKEQVSLDVMLIGNVDPVNCIAYGEESTTKETISKLLMEMKGTSNFVLSTGCDLPKDASLDNISLLFDLARG